MNKPVAWWTGEFDDESEDFIFPDTRQKFIDHPIANNHLLFPIPLYTHPVKELTDEEILEEIYQYNAKGSATLFELCKAILRKAQEK